jgi:mannitol/fructose-specific phosphotransferase system IIA component (Ntr-type)
MQLNNIFAPNAVITALPASSKAQVLRALAEAAAVANDLDPQEIFEILRERERLGSTAIGEGVAIPHAKVPGLDHLGALIICACWHNCRAWQKTTSVAPPCAAAPVLRRCGRL